MTSTTAADLRAALVEKLTSDGVVSDPEWRHAFAAVPREIFVPCFFQPRQDRPGWRLVEANQEWRKGVYTDEALVTQMNGDETAVDLARHDGLVEGQPTSSSSAPTLMASMLEALGVETGMRVLEIGTGSGYNAALLSHRLGAGQVTTVEVDPDLTAKARARLAEAGYAPTVICADGARGYAEGATYDRVIATVALPALPPAWLEQTQPGAVIVIPLRLAGHGGLMAQLPAQAVTGNHPAAFYLSLRSPSPYSVLGFRPDDPAGTPQTWGHGQDGSTFALTTVDGIELAGADGPLWPALEAAYLEWRELGQPTRDRLGLTVRPDGQHVVWIDDSRNPVATFVAEIGLRVKRAERLP